MASAQAARRLAMFVTARDRCGLCLAGGRPCIRQQRSSDRLIRLHSTR